MPNATQGKYSSDIIKYEAPSNYSREDITVLAGSGSARTLAVATVVGKATKSPTATGAAGAGNTGNGTITAAPTIAAGAKVGTWKAVCIEPATNAGRFVLEDPDGIIVSTFNVAVAQTVPFALTIADGSTDFVAGDFFTIVVAAGTGKVVAIDFSAVDGTENAYGVLPFEAVAPNGSDLKSVAVVRHAIVEKSSLVWPLGATTNQKNAAIAQLEAAGVLCRAGA